MSKIYGLTPAEQKKLAELEQKKAEADRQWREFLSEVRAHKSDVLTALKAVPAAEVDERVKAATEKADAEMRQRYNEQWHEAVGKLREKVTAEVRAEYGDAAAEHDALAAVARQYGCTIRELLAYIASGQQTDYYKRNHQ